MSEPQYKAVRAPGIIPILLDLTGSEIIGSMPQESLDCLFDVLFEDPDF